MACYSLNELRADQAPHCALRFDQCLRGVAVQNMPSSAAVMNPGSSLECCLKL